MAYSALTDLNTGQILTATVWQQLVDNDAYFKARSDNPARAIVTNSGALSFTTATPAVVAWNTETADSASMHDNVTNNSRITIPSGEDGTYLIVGYIDWAANATGTRRATIQLNGATVISSELESAASAGTTSMTVTAVYPLVATNYVEIVASQTSGGSLNVQAGSRFMVIRVA